MEIKILGTGCARCKKLYAETEKAIALSGVQASLSKVEDIQEIMSYRVMMTPALVINGQLKCSGNVPSATEIASMITTVLAQSEL